MRLKMVELKFYIHTFIDTEFVEWTEFKWN